MLIKCKECGLQISDSAVFCPHCGFVYRDDVNIIPRKKTHKRRLPNGFGGITKISNSNLRKPYRAMVTIGFNDKGRPISKLLKPEAYFKTYNEAYDALVKYHKKPYDKNSEYTIKELFKKWLDDHFDPKLNHSQYIHNISYFKKVKPIENIKAIDLRPMMLKEFIESLDLSSDYKTRIKYLFNMIYDYAVSLEIVDKNIARSFELSTTIKNDKKESAVNHIAFTEDELTILWANKNNLFIQAILIQCYMGWRPGELCSIKKENINLSDWTITGGSKTNAGRDRIVPIHSCIKQLVLNKYKTGFELYKPYRIGFQKLMKKLGMSHTPHDCRTTFVTLCKKYEVDEYAIKYMVGHQISDLTERVYTSRTIDWLKTEIEKIKVYE